MGDNGNLNPEVKQPEVKILFTIGINKENIIMVSGDLNNKNLCYHLLAEAIKIVADYKPAIIKSGLFDRATHRIMDFARHFKK